VRARKSESEEGQRGRERGRTARKRARKRESEGKIKENINVKDAGLKFIFVNNMFVHLSNLKSIHKMLLRLCYICK
jgi:collagenase-like PrtC family protease